MVARKRPFSGATQRVARSSGPLRIVRPTDSSVPANWLESAAATELAEPARHASMMSQSLSGQERPGKLAREHFYFALYFGSAIDVVPRLRLI